MTASNVIVSAAGVPEGQACGLSDEFLGELPTGSKVTAPPSVYVGGGSSEHSTASCTAVVAFEAPGWSDMKKATLSTVVRAPSRSALAMQPHAAMGPHYVYRWIPALSSRCDTCHVDVPCNGAEDLVSSCKNDALPHAIGH